MRGFGGGQRIRETLNDGVVGFLRRRDHAGVFRTVAETLGLDLEAGNAVLLDIDFLGPDGESDIEVLKRDRDAVFGEAAREFRALQPATINSGDVDRPEVDNLITGGLCGRYVQRHGPIS